VGHFVSEQNPGGLPRGDLAGEPETFARAKKPEFPLPAGIGPVAYCSDGETSGRQRIARHEWAAELFNQSNGRWKPFAQRELSARADSFVSGNKSRCEPDVCPMPPRREGADSQKVELFARANNLLRLPPDG
jgi:hypothetical protein